MAKASKTDIAVRTTTSRSNTSNNEAAAFWGALGGALLGEALRTPSPRPTYYREVPVYREVVREVVVVREERTLRGSIEGGRSATDRICNASSFHSVQEAEMAVRCGAAFSCAQVAQIMNRVGSFRQVEVAQALFPAVYDRYNWSLVVNAGSAFNRYALMAMV